MPVMFLFLVALVVYICYSAILSLTRAYERNGAWLSVARFLTYSTLSCYALLIQAHRHTVEEDFVSRYFLGYSPDVLLLFGPAAFASLVLLATRGLPRRRISLRAALATAIFVLTGIAQFFVLRIA
jgi:hypothetical protein